MTGHRSAAAALLLALLALTPSLSVCSGWMSSAGDRMACCDHSRGGHTQEMADTCCANGERQQHAEWLGLLGFALPAPQPLAWCAAIFVPPSPVSTFDGDAPEPSGSGSERRILLSVFLI